MADQVETVKNVNKKLQLMFKGKKPLKNISDISINLIALLVGLKPSVLWDFCSVDIEKLTFVLRNAFEARTHELSVLEVNGDLFVCELPSLVRHLRQCARNTRVVIDVSKNQSPCLANSDVLNQVTEMTLNVLQQIEKLRELRSTSDQLDVDFSTSGQLDVDFRWNVTTLYGLLLGFPVLYWFNHSESLDNCLSFQDLQVHSLEVSSEEFSGVPTSFSVPSSLAGDTNRAVLAWKEGLALNKKEGEPAVIQGLGIVKTSVRTVNLPVVAM